MNIETEQQVMTLATRENPREPSMSHRIVTFFQPHVDDSAPCHLEPEESGTTITGRGYKDGDTETDRHGRGSK